MKFVSEVDDDKINVYCYSDEGITKNLILRIYDLDTNFKLIEYSFGMVDFVKLWNIPPSSQHPINGFKIVIFENEIPIWTDFIFKKSICKTKFIDKENNLDLVINAALFLNYMDTYNQFKDDFFDIKSSELIIDLGSSVGTFTAYALEQNPKIKSINVEMNSAFHKICSDTFEDNPNIIPINAAIYKESDKIVEISSSKENFNDLANSVARQMWSDQIYKTKIKTISLQTIVEKYNIEKIDLLKVDIEGYEYEFFENLNDEILNKIDKIFFEFHLAEDKNRKLNLIIRLIKLGFKMVMTSPTDIYNENQFTIYFKK